MTKEESDTPSPGADIERWRRIISEKTLDALSMEEIVAGVQDLGPHCDPRVLNPLMRHLTDALTNLLRRRVGRNHPNEGKDIIHRAHAQIIDAVLQPRSADGKGLREAFRARVEFRLTDAIQAELKHARRHPTSDENKKGEEVTPKRVPEGAQVKGVLLEEHAYVEGLLAHIDDPRKLLAFRLFMEDVPIASKKHFSIEKAVGVSARTIQDWIPEIQELLKSKIGDRA